MKYSNLSFHETIWNPYFLITAGLLSLFWGIFDKIKNKESFWSAFLMIIFGILIIGLGSWFLIPQPLPENKLVIGISLNPVNPDSINDAASLTYKIEKQLRDKAQEGLPRVMY